MSIFPRINIGLIGLFILISSPLFAEYPGVTPGSFSVSDSGAANYTLPISTPAGVAGMSPNLAVSYSSQGGNGLMGVGFQLSGFSSGISRCGGSHATDGQASGVRYTNADKICMNGQRLILSSGTHWGNNAVYRTEMESFSKIVYKKTTTSSGNPSDYFEVYTKDGEIQRYSWRVTVSATGLYAGKNVSAWLKYFDQDRSGNRVFYKYQHLDGDRWIPKEAVWGAKAYADANRKVEFTYKPRLIS